MYLLSRVERFIRRSATPATKFGRDAVGDPNFVRDLRNGREPRPETVARVESFLCEAEGARRPPCQS